MRHRHEIDGLRAIAVVPVILFHAGFGFFRGGYVGVDIFFVISGYLITGLIIDDLKAGDFSLLRFYQRRARRILPALIFVILCCLPFAWAWMLPAQFKDFGQTLVAVIGFASNILFAFKHGYFAEGAIPQKPLLHTWSLGVEEQFYVLFPLALIGLWRFGRNPAFYCIAALALASLLFSEWGARHAPHYNFYLATSRAWELFAGSLCAFAQIERGQKTGNLLSTAGLCLIAVSIFAYDEETPFPSLYALAPVAGTCLVILYGAGGTFVCRLLSLRAFVGVGLISYSAYLWHQPLFAFARIRLLYPPDAFVMAGLSALSFLLALGSWKYVETPFRKSRPQPAVGTAWFVAASLVGMGGIAATGLYGHVTNGRESVWMASAPPGVARMYLLIADAKGPGRDLPQDNGLCKFNVERLDAASESRILRCFEKYGRGIGVLGDSHAIDLFGAVVTAADSDFVVGVTQGYCRPHAPLPFCQYDGFRSFVSRNGHVFRTVIFEQTGRSFLQDSAGRTGSNRMFTEYPMDERIPDYAVESENLSKVYEYLFALSAYTNVVWLGPRIEPQLPEAFLLKSGCDFRYRLRPNQEAGFRALDKAIGDRVRARGRGTRFAYVSLIDLIGFDAAADVTSCTQLFWTDGDHWSAHGESRFGMRLRPLFAKATGGGDGFRPPEGGGPHVPTRN